MIGPGSGGEIIPEKTILKIVEHCVMILFLDFWIGLNYKNFFKFFGTDQFRICMGFPKRSQKILVVDIVSSLQTAGVNNYEVLHHVVDFLHLY